MKQFNYNPFTWEPKQNKKVWYISSTGIDFMYYFGFPLQRKIKKNGIYKTKKDAKLAFKIAKEAILKNVKD